MKFPYVILSITIIAFACQKDVKLDLKNDNKLIVDGLVTDVKGDNYVKLYTTQDFYSNASPDSISDASVIVADDMENAFVFKEKPGTHGYYCNEDFQGKVGSSYKLKIQYNGKIYESSSILPPCILRITVAYALHLNLVEIQFYLTQPDTNYYKLCSFINDTLLDSLQWLYLLPGNINLNNTGIVTKNYPHRQSDSLKIEEQSLTKDAYLYYLNLATYMNSQEHPFNVPPVFPSGNISNGALGVFRASSIISRKIKF
jgi:hypothetical protein